MDHYNALVHTHNSSVDILCVQVAQDTCVWYFGNVYVVCFLTVLLCFDLSEDRMLTAADVQSFSNGVGRQWKNVGRALGKSCRALKSPAIDNLAYEYEREGLYEQAYQLLNRFIQAEGRAAKLSRLVRALEDCRLTSLAEHVLDLQP